MQNLRVNRILDEVEEQRTFRGLDNELWTDWEKADAIVEPNRLDECKIRLAEILEGTRPCAERELVQVLIIGNENEVTRGHPWVGYYVAEKQSRWDLDKVRFPRYEELQREIRSGYASIDSMLAIITGGYFGSHVCTCGNCLACNLCKQPKATVFKQPRVWSYAGACGHYGDLAQEVIALENQRQSTLIDTWLKDRLATSGIPDLTFDLHAQGGRRWTIRFGSYSLDTGSHQRMTSVLPAIMRELDDFFDIESHEEHLSIAPEDSDPSTI